MVYSNDIPDCYYGIGIGIMDVICCLNDDLGKDITTRNMEGNVTIVNDKLRFTINEDGQGKGAFTNLRD